MSEMVRLYLVLTLCGFAVFPFLRHALGSLPDRGYAAGRCFGLIASAWTAFLIVDRTGVPLTTPIALGALLLVGAASWTAACLIRRRAHASPPKPGAGTRSGVLDDLRRNAMTIACVEGTVLCGSLLFFWIERHNPAIDPDSERFMDYAFLKAYLRSPGLPVSDPWLAGAAMNYYHFGYAIAAFLVRAGAVSPARSFVAILALVHALVWAGAFGIGHALTGRRRGGVIAALLLLGAGNLEWVRQWAERGRLLPLDWFQPSRVIAGAISEFPWFSLLWGDLHPYVVALPVLLCALVFAVAEGMQPGPAPSRLARDDRSGFARARAAGFGLSAGALLATHPWDVPFVILAALTVAAQAAPRARLTRIGLFCLSALIGSALFAPFLRGFRQGGRTLALVHRGSLPAEWAMAFGPFLLLGLLLPAAREAKDAEGRVAARSASILAGTGLLAALACEIVYVKDFFSDTDLSRMNTVFKLHRVAWALFALATPILVERLLAAGRGRRVERGRHLSLPRGGRWRPIVIGAALLVIAAAAAVYPIAGTASWLRTRDEARRSAGPPVRASALSPGAGAEALFRALEPGDAAVAGWLERHAAREDVVLEETGDAYSWSSRIATFSGVPTILGWGNHEAGWRDDWRPIQERRTEIEAIYRDPASERAQELLRRYRVVWIVVGRRERERYGLQGSGGFEAIGQKRLDVGGTALFRVERDAAGDGR